MQPEQKAQLEANYKKFYVKGWDKLLKKLKTHGGEMLVPIPEPEIQVQWLLKDGRIFDTTKIKVKKGEPSKCHSNTGKLWAEDGQLQLVTGYALSKDGLWRQHSWLWNPDTGELIETTEPREMYFGVVLNEFVAQKFAMENVPEFQNPSKVTERIKKASLRIMQLLQRNGMGGIMRIFGTNEKVE